MSKITNNGLTWSGTGLHLCPYGNSGCQRVNRRQTKNILWPYTDTWPWT